MSATPPAPHHLAGSAVVRGGRGRTAVIVALAVLAALVLVPRVAGATAPATDGPRVADACDDHLVTLSPTGVRGDAQAAVIVAQALDAGREGWAHATWLAGADVALSAVLAVDAAGTMVALPAEHVGTVDGAQAVVFCGERTARTAGGERDAGGGHGGGAGPADGVEVEVDAGVQVTPAATGSVGR